LLVAAEACEQPVAVPSQQPVAPANPAAAPPPNPAPAQPAWFSLDFDTRTYVKRTSQQQEECQQWAAKNGHKGKKMIDNYTKSIHPDETPAKDIKTAIARFFNNVLVDTILSYVG
jgi:hypothetical protein